MPGRLVSSVPQDLVLCPLVPGGGRQGKAPTIQRLSLMGNTQPRDRDGMWLWVRRQEQRQHVAVGKGTMGQRRQAAMASQGGAAQAVTRPGECQTRRLSGRAGRPPPQTPAGVSPQEAFFASVLLASWEQTSRHPLLFAYHSWGGASRVWGRIGHPWVPQSTTMHAPNCQTRSTCRSASCSELET